MSESISLTFQSLVTLFSYTTDNSLTHTKPTWALLELNCPLDSHWLYGLSKAARNGEWLKTENGSLKRTFGARGQRSPCFYHPKGLQSDFFHMNTHVYGLSICEISFNNTLYYVLHKKDKKSAKNNNKKAPDLHGFCLFCIFYMRAHILLKIWPVTLHCYTRVHAKIWKFRTLKIWFSELQKNRHYVPVLRCRFFLSFQQNTIE